MKRISILACLSFSLIATAACRGGGGDDDDDGNTPDAPPSQKTTIKDVQNDAMPKGTPVALEGVIVTAIDAFGARTGDLWVQDASGGEFSGVKVFGAPLDQVANLVPGDIVTITGAEKDEFALTSDTSGRTVTELKGAAGGMMSITKTGSGAVPTPANVDAAAIGALPDQAARDAEWEKWEGVLIKVNNVAQLNATLPFSGGAEDQFAFDADGGLTVESVLASIPATAVAGFCHSSITGIGDYFFDYLLLPRGAADFGAAGTGCRVTTQDATIAEVQAGTKTGTVKLSNVFVTGISFNKRNLWVSSSLTATVNEGVFVFRGGNVDLDPAIVLGSKVNVTGTVQEFNDDMQGGALTEITSPSVELLPDAAGTLVPVTGQTAATLLVGAAAAAHESVLVTLTNVNVTTLGNAMNGFVATAVQGGTTFGIGTDILRFNGAGELKCYDTITGFWTNLQAASANATTKPNAFGFIPRTVGTGTGNCN